jgi:biopolymer transport protein ExbD
MKFGAKSPARFESGPNMTPLVDVVMVILIFLMLVGTFASTEFFLQQNAGTFERATSSDSPPPDFVPDEPIIIRVSQPSPDRFVAQADKIQTSSADDLSRLLKRTHDQLTSIGKPTDKISVIISPGNNVKHRHYIAVYEAALKAGFTKVSFAIAN